MARRLPLTFLLFPLDIVLHFPTIECSFVPREVHSYTDDFPRYIILNVNIIQPVSKS